MTKCPECSQVIRPEDVFCENCGLKLQQDPSSPAGQKFGFQLPLGIGSWKTLKWVIGVSVLVLLLSGMLCGVYSTRFVQGLSGTGVPKVVTATATPTSTNTPGPSPTPTATYTPTPTRTPTPTPTPHPTTQPGTVLEPGQTWYEDGLALHMELVEIQPERLFVDLILENIGDEPLLFEIWGDTIRMVSNLGHITKPPTNVYGELYFGWHGGRISLKPGERFEITKGGAFKKYNLANKDVSEVFVEVVGLSRIDRARWKYEIPH